MLRLPGFSAPAVLGCTLLAFLFDWLISALTPYCPLRHISGPRLWASTRLPLIRVHITDNRYDGFGVISE